MYKSAQMGHCNLPNETLYFSLILGQNRCNYVNETECGPVVIKSFPGRYPHCRSDMLIDRHAIWCTRYGDGLDHLVQIHSMHQSEIIGGFKKSYPVVLKSWL
ncbi:hypothetical protein TNCV_1601691 [Trichonephila clavipes]|nr:hypothetical protein TNCV_1601691 [Trichonephila clavipes]